MRKKLTSEEQKIIDTLMESKRKIIIKPDMYRSNIMIFQMCRRFVIENPNIKIYIEYAGDNAIYSREHFIKMEWGLRKREGIDLANNVYFEPDSSQHPLDDLPMNAGDLKFDVIFYLTYMIAPGEYDTNMILNTANKDNRIYVFSNCYSGEAEELNYALMLLEDNYIKLLKLDDYKCLKKIYDSEDKEIIKKLLEKYFLFEEQKFHFDFMRNFQVVKFKKDDDLIKKLLSKIYEDKDVKLDIENDMKVITFTSWGINAYSENYIPAKEVVKKIYNGLLNMGYKLNEISYSNDKDTGLEDPKAKIILVGSTSIENLFRYKNRISRIYNIDLGWATFKKNYDLLADRGFSSVFYVRDENIPIDRKFSEEGVIEFNEAPDYEKAENSTFRLAYLNCKIMQFAMRFRQMYAPS